MIRWSAALILSFVVAPAVPRPMAAQEQAPAIRWWHGAIVVGGLSVLTVLDEPTRQFVQQHRSATGDDVARAVRHFGESAIYLSLTAGLVAAGALSGNRGLATAGGHLVTTFGAAMLSTQAGKLVAGRARPGGVLDADDFVPFSGRAAMPSGHTALVFALATDLADDIDRPWATTGLYTLATAVGWSRLNDDQHWLSDVAAGAVLGIAAAKAASGRWRIFHLRPPHLVIGARRSTIGWHESF